MIHPGAVARHGRLGIEVNRTLVAAVDGRLYYGEGGGGGSTLPGQPVGGGSGTYVPLPPRMRKRIVQIDDVLRDDNEILLFIGTYLKQSHI